MGSQTLEPETVSATIGGLITPVNVGGTAPTAREPEKHIADEVTDTEDITKIDDINNEALLRPVTDDGQSPPAPEILVQTVPKASPNEDAAPTFEGKKSDIQAEMTGFQSPSETATDIALRFNDIATGHQEEVSATHNDDVATDACSVHKGEVHNNDHPLEHTQSEINVESSVLHSPADKALKFSDIAKDLQDEPSICHDDDHMAGVNVDRDREVEVPGHQVSCLAEDRDTSVAAAVASKTTGSCQVDLDATVEQHSAALLGSTGLLITDDEDHVTAVAVRGETADADQMEMDVPDEQRPAAPQETPDLSTAEQSTQHVHETYMMEIEQGSANDHILPATEGTKTNSSEIDMMDDIMREAAGIPDRAVLSTTDQAMAHDQDTDMKMTLVYESSEKHTPPTLSTAEKTTSHIHETEMMDGIVHEAPEQHNTEMRDAPEQSPVVSARDIVLDAVVQIENTVTPEQVASRCGRARSSALVGANISDVKPHVVGNEAAVLVPTPLNSQGPPGARPSLKVPTVRQHMVMNNASTPASASSGNLHSAAQMGINNPLMQRHRTPIVPASSYLNSPMPRHNIVTHGSGIPIHQRAPHFGGTSSNSPIPHPVVTAQQARPRIEQASERPNAAPTESEEPRDPWADQRVKVHKNKIRGRKKAEAEAKALADIIAKYSAPPRPGPRGIKRKLYIDHYGPDAYREHAGGDRGVYEHPVHCL